MDGRNLIVNADDLGASSGINRGIIQCHAEGIVTSASLMVTGRAFAEAVAMSREHPSLSVGLHWDVWGEDEREFDLGDPAAVRSELEGQLEEFMKGVGRPPTHVDSHRHAHRDPRVMPIFVDVLTALDIPIRGDGKVLYVGGFYAQWEWMKTELDYIRVPFLTRLLSEEVSAGWTELSCHPGFRSPGFSSIYDAEREVEIQTLTDPSVQETIEALGLELKSYQDYALERDPEGPPAYQHQSEGG